MQVVQSTGGIADTNSFLIADEATKKAVIVDAPDNTALKLVQHAKDSGWDVVALWLTHGHFDHVADHQVVTDHFPNAKILIHRLDEPKLQDPTSRFFSLPFKIPPRSADGYLEDGQELELGELRARVIFTPGHSPGHVMFHIPEKNVLIGGDLIICGAVGRTDLPGSDRETLNASIRRVMKLPPDTYLLPGHGKSSRLSDELRQNPYVREAMGLE